MMKNTGRIGEDIGVARHLRTGNVPVNIGTDMIQMTVTGPLGGVGISPFHGREVVHPGKIGLRILAVIVDTTGVAPAHRRGRDRSLPEEVETNTMNAAVGTVPANVRLLENTPRAKNRPPHFPSRTDMIQILSRIWSGLCPRGKMEMHRFAPVAGVLTGLMPAISMRISPPTMTPHWTSNRKTMISVRNPLVARSQD